MTEKEREAIQALQNDTRLFVNVSDVAPVLGCDAQSIRNMALSDIQGLGFKAIRVNHRIKIPRKEFLAYIGQKERLND